MFLSHRKQRFRGAVCSFDERHSLEGQLAPATAPTCYFVGNFIKSVLGIEDPKPVDTGPSAEASKYAADLQYKSTQEARELQREQYKQGREWLEPWFQTGRRALAMLELGSAQGAFQLPEWVGRELLPDAQRERLSDLRRRADFDRTDSEQARFQELQAKLEGRPYSESGGQNLNQIGTVIKGGANLVLRNGRLVQTPSALTDDEQREYERLGGSTRNRARRAELEQVEQGYKERKARYEELRKQILGLGGRQNSVQRNRLIRERNILHGEMSQARRELNKVRAELDYVRKNEFSPLTYEESKELEELEQASRDRLDDEDIEQFRGSLVPPTWKPFDAQDLERYKDPGYQFRVNEAERALRRQVGLSASTGGGRHLNALLSQSQQMASDEFRAARARALQDYTIAAERSHQQFGRLSQLAGIGQQQSNSLAALGSQYAGNVGQLGVHGAAALGAGAIGAANAGVMGQLYRNQAQQQANQNTFQAIGTVTDIWNAWNA